MDEPYSATTGVVIRFLSPTHVVSKHPGSGYSVVDAAPVTNQARISVRVVRGNSHRGLIDVGCNKEVVLLRHGGNHRVLITHTVYKIAVI